MKRLLVFYKRDWLHPKAGWKEHYLHEIFARIAAQGNHVLWVAHNHGLGKRKSPQLEIVDLIQIARLGSSYLYELTAGMFLKRLKQSNASIGTFDALFECIDHAPLNLHEHTSTPVVPLVFSLKSSVHASDSPPGPVIAATTVARGRIIMAGIPESFIIRAPFGGDPVFWSEGKKRASSPLLAVVAPNSGWFYRDPIYRACQQLKQMGISFDAEVLSPRKPRYLPPGFVWCADDGPESCRALFQRAWVGYCGAGAEQDSVAMAACGLPVLAPATEQGREFIEEERNGFLFSPGKSQALANRLKPCFEDEVLRKRLSHHARSWAENQSWDRSASLVLAAVENLAREQHV